MKEFIININGSIGEGENTYEFIKKKLKINHKLYKKRKIKIIVNINSLGGLVDDAIQIYKHLKKLSEHPNIIVETRCLQCVASSGSIIAQAASEGKRGIIKDGSYLIHLCTKDLKTVNSLQIDDHKKLLTHYDNQISDIYVHNSRGVLNKTSVQNIMERNYGLGFWQNSVEVISNGLADFIIKKILFQKNMINLIL